MPGLGLTISVTYIPSLGLNRMANFRKVPSDRVIHIGDTVASVPRMTISSEIVSAHGLEVSAYFMDGGEGVSETILPGDCCVVVIYGELSLNGSVGGPGDAFYIPAGVPFSPWAQKPVKYVMALIPMDANTPAKEKTETITNIDKSKHFKIWDIVDYIDGQIANLSMVKNDTLNLSAFAFGQGEKLKTHTAPGDALVIALEGEGLITIDGKPFTMKKGSAIVMPKDVPHSVEAVTPFKMLLIQVKK